MLNAFKDLRIMLKIMLAYMHNRPGPTANVHYIPIRPISCTMYTV